MVRNKRSLVTLFITLLTVIIFVLGWYVIMEKVTDHYDIYILAPSYFNA